LPVSALEVKPVADVILDGRVCDENVFVRRLLARFFRISLLQFRERGISVEAGGTLAGSASLGRAVNAKVKIQSPEVGMIRTGLMSLVRTIF